MEIQLEFEKNPFWILKVLLFGGHDWSWSTIIFNKHGFQCFPVSLSLAPCRYPSSLRGTSSTFLEDWTSRLSQVGHGSSQAGKLWSCTDFQLATMMVTRRRDKEQKLSTKKKKKQQQQQKQQKQQKRQKQQLQPESQPPEPTTTTPTTSSPAPHAWQQSVQYRCFAHVSSNALFTGFLSSCWWQHWCRCRRWRWCCQSLAKSDSPFHYPKNSVSRRENGKMKQGYLQDVWIQVKCVSTVHYLWRMWL